jgi:hypothetical protein
MKTHYLFFVVLILGACFQNPTDQEQEAQYNFEQRCKFDSIGQINTREHQLSDSMLSQGFEYFKVEHVYHFWRCKGRNELTSEEFFLKYKRKKPVPKSLQEKSGRYLMEITKHVFTNYISDNDIMKYQEFHIEDDFFGNQKTLPRDSIFEICGFKLVPISKMKWKRVLLK